MPKNIIICCDGTSNEFGKVNTNVVRLFQCLDRTQAAGQAVFYDPGVGTLSSPTYHTDVGRWWSKTKGLAFGADIMKHVEDALAFLALRYEPGDKIFIFGFSRGAFTTRIIAGILHKCGLREAGWDNLQPYFSENYIYGKDKEVNAAFKATFGKPCPVHFLGVWDTVSTVGWVYNPSHFQYTQNNPEVSHVRHAVSIDERRCFFRTNLWGASSDKKEIWFAGSHCDVGGGYPEEGPAPWKVPFQWMVREAEAAGLKFDDNRVRSTLTLGVETQESWQLSPIHQSLEAIRKVGRV